ncbi:MAG: hypothetical protein JW900_05295 [Anaerolineae bacterium]|nr:hypothetical protein [Anaerolineae bacterium]
MNIIASLISAFRQARRRAWWRKNWPVVLFLLLFVCPCPFCLAFGLADQAIREVGLLPTRTPRPPATATPTAGEVAPPTSDASLFAALEPLLVLPGDLPAGLDGAQVRDFAPPGLDDLPAAEVVIHRQFARGQEVAGGVTVFLFGAAATAEAGYDQVAACLEGQTALIADLGRSALSAETSSAVEVLFSHCAALVHVRMEGVDLDSALVYARRLDERLIGWACR